MPHTRGAAKRARQYAKRRLYNRAYKKAIKDLFKDVVETAKSGGADLAKAALAATKKLDKAAARRVIHPNKAARKKAQIAALLRTTPK